MACSIDWYVENEIIYVRYWGVISIEDVRHGLATTKAMIDGSPRHLVHVIYDVGEIEVPLNPKENLALVRESGTHPRAGWNVMVGEKSVLIRMGSKLGAGLLNVRIWSVDTVEESEAFLHDRDSAIRWENVNKAILEIGH
ncbi:MAG: hypothetical protein R3E39_23530 [Anaerolineae bacterium]